MKIHPGVFRALESWLHMMTDDPEDEEDYAEDIRAVRQFMVNHFWDVGATN